MIMKNIMSTLTYIISYKTHITVYVQNLKYYSYMFSEKIRNGKRQHTMEHN